ncbi:hypothetical protein P168DRAFT_309941 [Aspergillus campestris IBT 28561]|uniref:MYND-type domain-containing protein n=1 Tax=Aspergillus campestris (strain IBT 28561) TaxID=1392248 RepID=A0A2I1D771_ASPC2|nr:uncharacterized protein P168DRAFT_309941 [Aspergillus campestris IBT 28561]PKY05703.1 hypothetical protein P168DRAFT_309941 [Aspergillus campestris IBT 28561]
MQHGGGRSFRYGQCRGQLLPHSHFYPVGNTPAVCLTHPLPPEQDAHLLLLGCGDARNVLFTIYADLRKLDFTCCDLEPEIIARNIVLFTLLMDDEQNNNLQKIWNLYYHRLVDQDSLELLREQASKLKKLAATTDLWRRGEYGSMLRFLDSYTLTQVSQLWDFYSQRPPDGSAYENQQNLLHQEFQEAERVRSQIVGSNSMLGGLRSTAPVSTIAHDDLSTSYRRYWTYGVADPSQEANGLDNSLNPMLGTPNAALIIHHATDPVLDFHLATGYAPLSSNSPLKPNKGEDGSFTNACYQTAFVEFAAYAKTFRCARPRLTIRFIASDALALCHTLQHMNNTGNSEAHWYRNSQTYVPLNLDSNDFNPRSDHPAPLSFDAIDTSNLADHLGCINLLAAAGPLLNRKPTSTLSTELLVRCEGDLNDYLKDLLLGDLPTVALLFNLTPIQYWTGTTATSVWDERQLNIVLQDSLGEYNTRCRYIIQWKSARHSSQETNLLNDTTIPLQFEQPGLTNLLYQLYLRMVEDESLPVLATSRKELASGPSGFYTRASFVAILGLIHKSDLVNWSVFIRELCLLITRHHSSRSMSSYTSPQEMFVYLHMCGLPLPSDYELTPYRPVKGMPCPLQNWKTIPPTLCITIVVPRTLLGFLKMANPMDGSPIFHVVLNGPQTNGFGKLTFAGVRNSESCVLSVQHDGEPWTGIAPMIVSVIVPSSIIRQDRSMSTRVTLGLKPTVPVQRFMDELGQGLAICQSSLKDPNVLVTKHRPNMTGYQSISGNSVSPCARPKELSMYQSTDSQTHARVHVSLDKDLKVKCITVHVDIYAGPLQDKLRSKVAVSVFQDSIFGVSIRFQEGPLIEQVQLPCPVTMTGSETRIELEASYVEFRAPVATRSELSSRPDNFYWTGIYQQRPIIYNPHYISLDQLPILDIEESVKLKWLINDLADMWSETERAFRERNMATNLRSNFKNTLLKLFVDFAGVQDTKHHKPFSLSDPQNGGLFALIFPANLRLDLPHQTVVLDVAIIPLSNNSIHKITSLLSTIETVRSSEIKIDERESLLWKHTLPAMVERCRTWKHKRACEYIRAEKMPLSLETGDRYICSCGKGTFPAGFWSRNKGDEADLWRLMSKHAIRAAISPCFSVPFVERQYTLPLAKPGPVSPAPTDNPPTKPTGLDGKRGLCAMCGKTRQEAGGLRECNGCRVAEYCSRECHLEHWRGEHKGLCRRVDRAGSSM